MDVELRRLQHQAVQAHVLLVEEHLEQAALLSQHPLGLDELLHRVRHSLRHLPRQGGGVLVLVETRVKVTLTQRRRWFLRC